MKAALIGLATVTLVAICWSGALNTWVVVLLAVAVARFFGHH